ncbi:flagellar FliJ protein [Arthrobacter pigmenti]|uniref:Flagellar FliJ protein n=1 Tax=Arthrobacter pigmenti TaxID=271432 RepID=A0A846RJ70_9MICC|nr:flagellar FliJ protein [Arthrobacter pigmenti]
MNRRFPLAGLLRLRQVNQDQAAADLAAANGRLRESSARRRQALVALDGSTAHIADTAALHAIAAARSAARGMLTELAAVEDGLRSEATRAQEAFNAARTQTIGLEKLKERHAAEVSAEDLRTEQKTLDELASRTRGNNDAH